MWGLDVSTAEVLLSALLVGAAAFAALTEVWLRAEQRTNGELRAELELLRVERAASELEAGHLRTWRKNKGGPASGRSRPGRKGGR